MTIAWGSVSILRSERGPVEVAHTGAGPAILVFHGVPGSWRQPFSIAEDFGDRYQVIGPSRPGYGETPLATGRTSQEQAGAYAAVLDAMGVDRASVIGVSGGGPPAVAFAERYPERTTALILCCAAVAHLIRAPRSMHILRPYLVGESLSALGRAVTRLRLRSPDGLERMAAESLPEADAALFREDGLVRDGLVKFLYSHLEAPPGLAGLRNDLTQIRRARKHPRETLAITAPTLVLHGTADDVVPLDEAEFHARAIPGASIEIYEGAGHVFMLTRRAEVTSRIGEFLARAAR